MKRETRSYTPLSGLNRRRPRLPRSLATSDVIAILLAGAIAGCGSDSGGGQGADLLPPGGYHEQFLTENPTAAVNHTHTVALHM